jgi:hypothetical protein
MSEINLEEDKGFFPATGNCVISNTIIEGSKVGFMYREEPEDGTDSGWRFLSGSETQQYVNNPKNSKICDISVISELDPAIVPYLHLPFETELERIEATENFRIIE